MRFKVLTVFAAFVAVTSLAACSEDVGAGGACPLLCPQESAPIRDTILDDAITIDTSIGSFPALGFEPNLVLETRGDTLDSRIVLRYDSLPTTYKFGVTDSTIVRIDSAYLRGIVTPLDTALKLEGGGTIEAYDITDAVNDTAVASLEGQVTPANLIGSITIPASEGPDTVTILLDTARVRSRVLSGQRLRIALRLVSETSERIRFVSQQQGEGFVLILHPNRNPDVPAPIIRLRSKAPADIPSVASALADFHYAALGTIPPTPDILRVGGFGARRVLLRFSLPASIVDSTVVIRATLTLTQRPTASAEAGDKFKVHIVPVVVSSIVRDPRQLLEFAGSPSIFQLDSIDVTPKDSVVHEFQIVNLVRSWRAQDTLKTPRAAALVSTREFNGATWVDFFSKEAPIDVRPRLRLTYVTRVGSGRP